jgi:hypothetical protein
MSTVELLVYLLLLAVGGPAVLFLGQIGQFDANEEDSEHMPAES